jgi:hypothetical protein
MGNEIGEIKLILNEKYALTDKEIKKATKEAGSLGNLPDFTKVRPLEKLPVDEIETTLKEKYSDTNFTNIHKELRELVMGYDGKKPDLGDIKKVLGKYL